MLGQTRVNGALYGFFGKCEAFPTLKCRRQLAANYLMQNPGNAHNYLIYMEQFARTTDA